MKPDKGTRNDIHDAVVAGGLDPRECDFDYDDDWARITHRPSGSYFDLKGNITRYVATPIIGDQFPMPLAPFGWADLEMNVRHWARAVRRDFDVPDKWEDLAREHDVLTGARYIDVENSPFTPDERAEIAEQFEQIKRSARATYGLSDERIRMLGAKLDEVLSASSRMGRKDWVLVFSGAVLGLILTDLLPPSVAQSILLTVLHGLEHLFGSGGGQHLLPPM